MRRYICSLIHNPVPDAHCFILLCFLFILIIFIYIGFVFLAASPVFHCHYCCAAVTPEITSRGLICLFYLIPNATCAITHATATPNAVPMTSATFPTGRRCFQRCPLLILPHFPYCLGYPYPSLLPLFYCISVLFLL